MLASVQGGWVNATATHWQRHGNAVDVKVALCTIVANANPPSANLQENNAACEHSLAKERQLWG